MSFSLNDTTRSKAIKSAANKAKKDEIALCFGIAKGCPIANDTIRLALKTYLMQRLKRFSTTNLNHLNFESNLKELFEFCCGKPYNEITTLDVNNNEALILQHIKWCIEYGNTKRLIWDPVDESDDYIVRESPSVDTSREKVNLEELYEFFGL